MARHFVSIVKNLDIIHINFKVVINPNIYKDRIYYDYIMGGLENIDGIQKGDLILFLDADIILPSNSFLKNILARFKKRKLDLASFPIYPKGNWIDKIVFFLYNDKIHF